MPHLEAQPVLTSGTIHLHQKTKDTMDQKIIENKVKLRQLTPNDYNRIVRLQEACFPEMKPWSKEQFLSIMSIFSEGQFCIEYKRKIIASSCCLIIDFSNYSETSTWAELTDRGFFTNHDPNGDTLYGAEIMVDPEFRAMKLSRRLYEARKNLAKARNLKRISIGGRLPNYYKYKDEMDIERYVEMVMDRRIFDPVLTAQLSNGFTLKRILPDYLPNDLESCGYATFLEWSNLLYNEKTDKRKRHSPYVRVCAVQYQMRMIESFDEFARHCEYFVDVASDYRSDFVIFPEMFTMQLLTFLPKKYPSEAVRQLTQFTGRYIELFSSLAIKYNINIIGGSHLTVEDGDLYNISYLFRRDGTIDKQYKIHITPHERKWWGVKPGNEVKAFDTDCGKISILICYDIEFPELSRIARNKGAEMIFVPFNTDDRRAYLRVRYCAHARAIENQVYTIITGCVGNLPEVDNLDVHFSQSAILTPSDSEFHREGIASEAIPNAETVITQDLDMDLLKRNREIGSVQTWDDRRTDLYSIHYNEQDKTRKL